MGVKRIVPNISSDQPDLCRDFYAGFLGLDVAMDMGWIATYASPINPSAQLTVLRPDGAAPPLASVSVEVEDIEAMYRAAVGRGYRVIYPLTDEPWGVRRFFVADPNGAVLNIMCHGRSPVGGQEGE